MPFGEFGFLAFSADDFRQIAIKLFANGVQSAQANQLQVAFLQAHGLAG